MPDRTLFETSDDDLLISVYHKQGRTLDDLPYTDAFEAIYQAMYGDPPEESSPSRNAVFHRLHNLRKAGKLPRLGRFPSKPPRITPEQEGVLLGLVEKHAGKLSLRDRLPYTGPFDELVDGFNGATGLDFSRHDTWRVIARLTK